VKGVGGREEGEESEGKGIKEETTEEGEERGEEGIKEEGITEEERGVEGSQ
jgi:hypothetical protein